MDTQEITNVLLGLLAAGIPTVTFVSTSRASRIQARAEAAKAEIEERGVDALAYGQAAELYKDLIESLRVQIDRLEDSNRRLAEEVSTLRKSNSDLVEEVLRLRAEITDLRRGTN